MRIRVKPSRRATSPITLNLASMIDVTFLLLTYFMVTTVIARPEDRLSPTLQTVEAEGASASDFQPQIVRVERRGDRSVYVLGATEHETKRALAEALARLPKAEGVFVDVADAVDVGFAVGALQAAHDAGFDQVTYVPQR